MQRSVKAYQVGSTPTPRTMIGTIINTILVFVGGAIGLKVGKKIPDKFQQSLMGILALIVIFLGIKMSLETKNALIIISSLLLGGCLGELLDLDNRLNQGLTNLVNRFTFIEKDKNFSQALITASLMFCGGPMMIFGSIEAGVTGNNQTLIIKAILDGITAVPLAASLLKNILTPALVMEMTSVGGILLLTIGMSMFGINKKIKPINLVPAVFIAPIILSLIKFFI